MPGFEVFGNEERKAINDLFDANGGILFRHGFDAMRKGVYKTIEFEKAFASYLNAKYALGVTSGTAAIKVGLRAVGVGPGDEVITQDFTFIATMEAIIDLGAKPVLVSVDKTLNMDPKEIVKKITKKTKAILPVHMLGVACDMDPIMKIAKEYKLSVVEDNCESMGAKYGDQYLGTIGDAGAISLDFGKVITTGEGGMVVTNNEEVYKLSKEYHDHGHESNPNFPRNLDTRRIFGFNYRMNELQAAVGIEQLKKLDYIRSMNKKHHKAIMEGLKGTQGLEFRHIPEKCEDLCDTIIFFLPNSDVTKKFVAKLGENNMGTKNVPDALDWHFAKTWAHMFSQYGMSKEALIKETKKSDNLLSCSIALPIMVKYDDMRINYMIDTVKKIAKELL